VKGRPKLADTAVKCILLGYYNLPGTQSKAYKCYDLVKHKVYKSRDVTFFERGRSSGSTEVITDLRNLPPIVPIVPSTSMSSQLPRMPLLFHPKLMMMICLRRWKRRRTRKIPPRLLKQILIHANVIVEQRLNVSLTRYHHI
jgi:hypothetical protein